MCVGGILNRGGLTQLETDRATIHNAPVAGMHFSLTIRNTVLLGSLGAVNE